MPGWCYSPQQCPQRCLHGAVQCRPWLSWLQGADAVPQPRCWWQDPQQVFGPAAVPEVIASMAARQHGASLRDSQDPPEMRDTARKPMKRSGMSDR